MPEGDTIAKLARRVNARFAGRALEGVTIRDPRVRAGTTDVIPIGSSLSVADAVGKYLLMRFDDRTTLYSHLGLDGRWCIDKIWPRPAWQRQLELDFGDGTLTASALTKVGVVATSDEALVVGHLGPDLCGPTPPDPDMVAAYLSTPEGAELATAMLDQRRVAGWGNVFAVEVPFIMGLDPARSTTEIGALADLVRIGTALIRWSADGHRRNTTGRNIGRADHFVYATRSGRCPVCGSSIRATDAESTAWTRASWVCPACQSPDHTVADMARARRLLALHPALRLL